MSESIDHVFIHYIRTDAASLWKALTTADATVQWFHGLRVQSGWHVGDDLAFVPGDDPDGRATIVGEVLEVRPRESVRFGFAFTTEDDPPTRVRWQIEERGGVCRLTVTHVGFAEHNTTWHQTAAGWPAALSSLKSLLETGRSLQRLEAFD